MSAIHFNSHFNPYSSSDSSISRFIRAITENPEEALSIAKQTPDYQFPTLRKALKDIEPSSELKTVIEFLLSDPNGELETEWIHVNDALFAFVLDIYKEKVSLKLFKRQLAGLLTFQELTVEKVKHFVARIPNFDGNEKIGYDSFLDLAKRFHRGEDVVGYLQSQSTPVRESPPTSIESPPTSIDHETFLSYIHTPDPELAELLR